MKQEELVRNKTEIIGDNHKEYNWNQLQISQYLNTWCKMEKEGKNTLRKKKKLISIKIKYLKKKQKKTKKKTIFLNLHAKRSTPGIHVEAFQSQEHFHNTRLKHLEQHYQDLLSLLVQSKNITNNFKQNSIQ